MCMFWEGPNTGHQLYISTLQFSSNAHKTNTFEGFSGIFNTISSGWVTRQTPIIFTMNLNSEKRDVLGNPNTRIFKMLMIMKC